MLADRVRELTQGAYRSKRFRGWSGFVRISSSGICHPGHGVLSVTMES